MGDSEKFPQFALGVSQESISEKAEKPDMQAEPDIADTPRIGEWADLESEAPFLAQAFKLMSDFEKNVMASGIDVDFDDYEKYERMEAWAEKEREACAANCQELFGKSFDHHDTNGDGVLSKDEAAVFFKHYVDGDQLHLESVIEYVAYLPSAQLMEDMDAQLDEWREHQSTLYEDYRA